MYRGKRDPLQRETSPPPPFARQAPAPHKCSPRRSQLPRTPSGVAHATPTQRTRPAAADRPGGAHPRVGAVSVNRAVKMIPKTAQPHFRCAAGGGGCGGGGDGVRTHRSAFEAACAHTAPRSRRRAHTPLRVRGCNSQRRRGLLEWDAAPAPSLARWLCRLMRVLCLRHTLLHSFHQPRSSPPWRAARSGQ